MSITVRRASVQDAAAYARIMGDPSVYPGLMQMPYTNEELWRARLTGDGGTQQDRFAAGRRAGRYRGGYGRAASGGSIPGRHALPFHSQ